MTAAHPPQCEVFMDVYPTAGSVVIGETGRRVELLARRDWYGSAASTSEQGQAVDDLLALYQRTRVDGWDGYDASAISTVTFERAYAFLRSVPRTVPVPEIIPEPSGTIAFEWQRGRDQIFSVSVSEGYKLVYAGLFGLNKAYGTELFIDEFPKPLMAYLRRVYPEQAIQRSA